MSVARVVLQSARLQEGLAAARRDTRAVVRACGAALARDVQEQHDAQAARALRLRRRTHALHERLRALQTGGGGAWLAACDAQLAAVRELLHATAPNASDATSLDVRGSLVKVTSTDAVSDATDVTGLRCASSRIDDKNPSKTIAM